MNQRYEVLSQLGQGGAGAVWLARDNQLQREVAIKRLLKSEKQEDATESLLNEATALSSLNHPNIITVHDVGEDEQGPYVVMEYLEGETLEDLVQRGALTWEDFQGLAQQALEGLLAAQQYGLMHRDIKPGNLMVVWRPSGSFAIKLLDFGLAKFSPKPSKQTVDQGDAIMGSIYFMAPEQFERRNLDGRTDLYSLGAVFYYSLTGHYPFDGDNAPQVMAAHLEHKVDSLLDLRPDLPEWASRWVHWLMARDRDDRPADAEEALRVLVRQGEGLVYRGQHTGQTGVDEDGMDGATSTVGVRAPEAVAAKKMQKKSRTVPLIALGVGLVVLLMVGLFAWNMKRGSDRLNALLEQGSDESVESIDGGEKEFEILADQFSLGYDLETVTGDQAKGRSAVQAMAKLDWEGTDQAVKDGIDSSSGVTQANFIRTARMRGVDGLDALLLREMNDMAKANRQLALSEFQARAASGTLLSASQFDRVLELFVTMDEDDVEFRADVLRLLDNTMVLQENKRLYAGALRDRAMDDEVPPRARYTIWRYLAMTGDELGFEYLEGIARDESMVSQGAALTAIGYAPEGRALDWLLEYALERSEALGEGSSASDRRNVQLAVQSVARQLSEQDPEEASTQRAYRRLMDGVDVATHVNALTSSLASHAQPWVIEMLEEMKDRVPNVSSALDGVLDSVRKKIEEEREMERMERLEGLGQEG